jgi:hypothetical protein
LKKGNGAKGCKEEGPSSRQGKEEADRSKRWEEQLLDRRGERNVGENAKQKRQRGGIYKAGIRKRRRRQRRDRGVKEKG